MRTSLGDQESGKYEFSDRLNEWENWVGKFRRETFDSIPIHKGLMRCESHGPKKD